MDAPSSSTRRCGWTSARSTPSRWGSTRWAAGCGSRWSRTRSLRRSATRSSTSSTTRGSPSPAACSTWRSTLGSSRRAGPGSRTATSGSVRAGRTSATSSSRTPSSSTRSRSGCGHTPFPRPQPRRSRRRAPGRSGRLIGARRPQPCPSAGRAAVAATTPAPPRRSTLRTAKPPRRWPSACWRSPIAPGSSSSAASRGGGTRRPRPPRPWTGSRCGAGWMTRAWPRTWPAGDRVTATDGVACSPTWSRAGWTPRPSAEPPASSTGGQGEAIRIAAERLRHGHAGPPPPDEVRRLAAALQRRGFDMTDIRAELRRLCSDPEGHPDGEG